METRLRMLIVLAVLSEPEVDVEVSDVDGRVLCRFDLSCLTSRSSSRTTDVSTARTSTSGTMTPTAGTGSTPMGGCSSPVFSRGIDRDPAKTVGRVQAALRSRGAVLPRRLSDEWRPFFPGH
jgi:hypothetical protein